MSVKGLFLASFLGIIAFLLVDHARIHNGKFATIEDFRNAIFNCVKSHEGIIFITVVFMIGFLTGLSCFQGCSNG